MWIIHLLPDAWLLHVCHALIALGLLGFVVASFIKIFPYINIYRLPIQIASVLLFTLGVYWRGGYAVEQEWQERVRQVEAQLAEARKRSQKINTKIVTRVVKKVERHTVYRDKIRREIQIQKEYINRDCKLNPQAVELYNRAVQGEEAK